MNETEFILIKHIVMAQFHEKNKRTLTTESS